MVPILITCWKRPFKVYQLIEAIRPLAPSKIYVACDGPNKNIINNKEKVQETKKIILNNISWPCKLETFFSRKNYGCRYGMTRAIDWFFKNEEEGIILEDDCIPSEEFLSYCEQLLEKYRNDQRIWSISGSNFQNGKWRGDGSYYFSKYFHCWGWATWRNRWINLDSDLTYWKKGNKVKILESIFNDIHEENYWRKIFDNLVYKNKPDSWAYRWAFTCFVNNGMSIIPNKNLINNIGFDSDATNTSSGYLKTSIEKGLIPLIHPASVSQFVEADKYVFQNHFNTATLKFKLKKGLKYPLYYPKRIIKFLKEFLL